MSYLKYFNKIDTITDHISIRVDAFEKEASELGITTLNDFYDSKVFKAKHKIVDKNIICNLS